MAAFDPFCTSAYLTLRYVPRSDWAWAPNIVPQLPSHDPKTLTPVRSASEILAFLTQRMRRFDPARAGLLLSGGIDSAILAALLPRGTRAYTIRFVAPGAIDESERAALFASTYGLSHHVVDVTWQDFLDLADPLMQRKRSPLHAIEVGLHKAARAAASDGLDTLIVGNGADSTFGGMDKLLSRDWSFAEFVARYTFVEPERALVEPRSMLEVFEPYRRGAGIDVTAFLKQVHGLGIVQSFENAIEAAGCEVVAPYEELSMAEPLDLLRIRNGEPKYLLAEVFGRLFHEMHAPTKIPFARPMDQWLSRWQGPTRSEFRGDIRLAELTGDQKWLVYCLERFLNLADEQDR